jgi:hypothetical protein
MSERFYAELPTIDQAALTPVLRRALDSETVQVVDWDCQPLQAGVGLASSVFRVSGQARDQGDTIPWSLILKVVRLLPHADDPGNVIYYWKREVLAYQTGLLDDLPGGLAAPACYGVVEQPGQGAWLWLEDVADACGPRWPLEQYGVAAHHLGQFNGAYLVGRPLPAASWLSRGWLRAFVEQAAPAVAQLRENQSHPLVRRWLRGDGADRIFRLWAERATLLDALERLPQTFCHMDAFRRNLFVRWDADAAHREQLCDQTVAVDWAFTGSGAVGEEIVPLVWGSVLFDEVELSQARELEQIVRQGYLQGLRDAGWRGDPRLAHLGYAAASALRYTLGAALGEFLAVVLDESLHATVEQWTGRSVEEGIDLWAERFPLQLAQAEEARELLDALT